MQFSRLLADPCRNDCAFVSHLRPWQACHPHWKARKAWMLCQELCRAHVLPAHFRRDLPRMKCFRSPGLDFGIFRSRRTAWRRHMAQLLRTDSCSAARGSCRVVSLRSRCGTAVQAQPSGSGDGEQGVHHPGAPLRCRRLRRRWRLRRRPGCFP